MSKMIKLLQKAAHEREHKEQAFDAQPSVHSVNPIPRVPLTKAQSNMSWVVGIALIIVALALIIVSASLVYTIRSRSIERGTVEATLKNMETKMSAQSWQLDELSGEIRSLRTEIISNQAFILELKGEIVKLRQDSESQKAAIENLTKAKNTLFNKVNELQAQKQEPSQQAIVDVCATVE